MSNTNHRFYFYQFSVLNSKGHVSHTFIKDFASHEMAENYRKTEEVTTGFKVNSEFVYDKVLGVPTTESADVHPDTSFVKSEQLNFVKVEEEPTVTVGLSVTKPVNVVKQRGRPAKAQ